MVNPPPYLQSVVDSAKRMLTDAWVRWFNYLAALLLRLTDYTAVASYTPTTGFAITVPTSTLVVQLVPAGTLATGALTTPANPVDGQPLEIMSTSTVTSFSVVGNTGQTVLNSPTTLLAGVGVAFYYNKTLSKWYRRY